MTTIHTQQESPIILEEPELEEKLRQKSNENQKSEPIPITERKSQCFDTRLLSPYNRDNTIADSDTSIKNSVQNDSIARSHSVSSSSQRPHSLESDHPEDKQKKQIDKESAHTLSWNDVSGECDTPGCQSKTIRPVQTIKSYFFAVVKFATRTTGTLFPVS